ncbi:MAG: type II secretion system protein GspM [Acidobacteria bacterium]|nr:type II secretion system protein GspM [Acidobacteriota bacterium]
MIENLSDRERKLLMALIPALLVTAFVYFWTEPAAGAPPVVDTAAAIEVAKLRLDRARATSALLPARQETRKMLQSSLASAEKRFIMADTAAQAQAQLNQIFRRVARAQGPAVEIRGMDIGSIQPVNAYAEILIGVNFDCQVEGLVNLLTDLSTQPEAIGWRDLRVSATDSKQKRLNVSLTFIGLTQAKPAAKPAAGSRG